MTRYLIPWSISGEFVCDETSASAAEEKFHALWADGEIKPKRDGKLWARRPIELVDGDDDT